MSSRHSILRAIRDNRPDATDAPPVPRFSAEAGGQEEAGGQGELASRFQVALEGVGGRLDECSSADASGLQEMIRRHYPDARAIACGSDCPPVATLEVVPDPAPADLVEIELAVVRGRLGVAENGAVWVDGASLPHPALPFVAEHLVLLLDRRELVADLHDAYRALAAPDTSGGPATGDAPAAREWPDYGVFISGPSKTADIEQALVMGAQGPRTCLVILEDPRAPAPAVPSSDEVA